jgi:hypothetical protein
MHTGAINFLQSVHSRICVAVGTGVPGMEMKPITLSLAQLAAAQAAGSPMFFCVLCLVPRLIGALNGSSCGFNINIVWRMQSRREDQCWTAQDMHGLLSMSLLLP